MTENYLIEKSVKFGSRIVKLRKYMLFKQRESIISKQILRSGTSIGANINEANYAQSLADFISKMHIALKETAETEYWIKILYSSDYIDEKLSNSLLTDCIEIKKLLVSTINTSKNNLKKDNEKKK